MEVDMKKYVPYIIVIVVLFLVLAAVAWYVYKPDGNLNTAYDSDASETSQNNLDDTKKLDNKPTATNAEKEEKSITTPLTIYYVALEDNGVSGEKIGCGDSLVADTTGKVATTNKLLDSMQRLLNGKSQYLGRSGLYDALYSSDLTVKSATVNDEVATVDITGDLVINGTCDAPRIKAQLRQMALTASDTSQANISINGKPLDTVLGAK